MSKKQNINKKQVKKEEDLRDVKISIVGVGGGGGSIVSKISSELSKVQFYAVNTDTAALKEATRSPKIKAVPFGEKETNGLGTGMDKKIGLTAAQNDIEKVKKIFEKKDVVIFVASLGGGTGSGATPYFAQVAKEMGCLVYGIFTLPFELEGDKKMKVAKDSVREIAPHLHAITVLPNEKIFEVVEKTTPLDKALGIIYSHLAEGLEGLIETIYETGTINIDFADFKTILENKDSSQKLTYLHTIEASLEEGAQQIVKKATTSPLYPYGIDKAKGVLFNITGGKDIALADFSAISEIISEFTDDKAKIIIGSMQKQKLKNKVKIALLATGCETNFLKKELADDKKVEKKEDGREKEAVKSIKKTPVVKKVVKPATIKDNVKEPEKKEQKNDIPEKKEQEMQQSKVSIVSSVLKEEDPRPVTNNDLDNELEQIHKEEERWEKPAFLKDNY